MTTHIPPGHLKCKGKDTSMYFFPKATYFKGVIPWAMMIQTLPSNMHYSGADEGHFSRAMNSRPHKAKPNTEL